MGVPGVQTCALPISRRGQRPVLLVDRADPAEVRVVLGDVEQALARDAAAAGDVLEERHDVVGPLWATEAEHEQRLPPSGRRGVGGRRRPAVVADGRSEEHTSELQSRQYL